MTTVFIAAGIFALLFAMMAVGVLLGRKPISGSCGGVGANGACSTCGAAARGECDGPEHAGRKEGDPAERETIYTSLLR